MTRLAWPAPKVFCSSQRRHPSTFYVISECSFHPGHEGDHRDVHNGHTWK